MSVYGTVNFYNTTDVDSESIDCYFYMFDYFVSKTREVVEKLNEGCFKKKIYFLGQKKQFEAFVKDKTFCDEKEESRAFLSFYLTPLIEEKEKHKEFFSDVKLNKSNHEHLRVLRQFTGILNKVANMNFIFSSIAFTNKTIKSKKMVIRAINSNKEVKKIE